jgi:hypothetical protein
MIIAMNAATGLAGSLAAQPALVATLDWPLLALIAAVGTAGSLTGRRLAGRFDDRALRTIFAGALVLLALVVLRDALPKLLAGAPVSNAVALHAPGSEEIVRRTSSRLHSSTSERAKSRTASRSASFDPQPKEIRTAPLPLVGSRH